MSLVVFTRPWFNDFFIKIIRSSEIFSSLRTIFITEFSEDAEKYHWKLLKPLKEDIYECNFRFLIDEVIKRDRLLRNINRDIALKMISNCYKQISEIISKERPKYAFVSSVDNYTTDLFIKVCEQYNVIILPFCGFFINGRFRFTKYGEPIYVHNENGILDLHKYFKNRDKPIQNQNIKKITLDRRIKRFIYYKIYYFISKYLKNKEDYKNGNFFSLVHFYEYTAMPKFFLKDLFIRNYFKSDLSDIKIAKPIIYIALHYIPEATIDYWGSIDLIDHDGIILRLIKEYYNDYQFIIKEHPVMFGKRNLNFYDQIKKIKDVILLNPYFDNYNIIEKSDVILTWAGSVGVEAIYYDKKCINIIKPYYYIENFTTYAQNKSQLFSGFNNIIERLKKPNDAIKVKMNKLINDITCAGAIYHRNNTDENTIKIVQASEAMVKKYE
jgi:hypothetical protein